MLPINNAPNNKYVPRYLNFSSANFSIRKVLRYVSTALAKNSVAEIGCHSRVKKGKVAQRSGITYSKNSTTHGHNIINDN